MELKDFVSQSLIQIIDGIKDAQKHADVNQAEIVPVLTTQDEGHRGSSAQKYLPIEKIKFSVVVTTTDGSKSEAGAGIFVGAFGIGGRTETGESSEGVSRIEFEIPVRYPNIEERTRAGGVDIKGPGLAD